MHYFLRYKTKLTDTTRVKRKRKRKILPQSESGLPSLPHFAAPRLEQCYVTNWGDDPHSMGSYSYVATGASFLKHVRSLACPSSDNLIHFAGECCSETNFTMLQGAVETGAAAGSTCHRTTYES